ncbi:hypothetical protein RB195_010270 [Necator americanus]|uniref:Uncharacterized protein n=2 Tax=Necator americanus TaxID=51031 RepID=A0ABR1CZ09_NECAM|nr:hypothetical protein NECAME_07237 [Necator americanus]ETN83750.1 hypothetical protein NECAME_07237 [Necator americanus]
MNDETCPSQPTVKQIVKIPRNRLENRLYKQGLVDDNNVHLSYFNFRVLWPALALSVTMYALFLVGVVGSLQTDHLPTPLELRKAFWTKYGSFQFRCNSTVPFPKDALPSILNLFEINVIGNVMFRLCSCLPIAVRLFVVHCRRTLIRRDFETSSFIHNLMNEVVPALTFVELFAMALFSIVAIRKDSPVINRYCKIAFAITAAVNMIITSAVLFAHKKNKPQRLDSISIFVKLVSTSLFCYTSPHYFQRHQASISFPICHVYLPRIFALMEYVMIASYGAFHFTSLIDIRNVTFLCYPRTCSGECEPLDPENFKKGEKYEHCRAYEYQQRLILAEKVKPDGS